MSNKTFYISALIAIVLSIFINHKIYGNSNATISNYEVLQELNRKRIKKQKSKDIANYMYNRIKFYQEFDTWYERHYALEIMYEGLQNMEIK